MSIAEAPLHPFIQPVEGSIGDRTCFVCGLGFDGDRVTADGVIPGRRFVELRLAGAEAVEGARVHTRHDEPGATVTMVRSATSGEPVPIVHEHMLVCSDCLTAGARIVGLGDVTLTELELEGQRERAEIAEGKLIGLRGELENLKDATRSAQLLTTLLEAERSEPKTNRRSAAK